MVPRRPTKKVYLAYQDIKAVVVLDNHDAGVLMVDGSQWYMSRANGELLLAGLEAWKVETEEARSGGLRPSFEGVKAAVSRIRLRDPEPSRP